MDFDLIRDQEYILEEICRLALEHGVDAVVIAGDVYDRSIPSEAAVNLFDSFLCKMAEKRIQTFIISGNHDSDDRLNFGSALFASNRIFIAAKAQGTLYHQVMQDSYGEVHVYLMPFIKASQVRHFLPEEKIDTYDDAVRAVIRHSDVDTGARNMIIAHQYVTAHGHRPVTSGSESMAVQNVGLVEEIGYDCFDPFDYAALGHIHSAQKIGRQEVRYAGSPLKYSLSEVNSEKSIPLVTMGEKGKVEIELLPLKPLREVRHLRGTRAQLLNPDNILSQDDYIYVTLTEEEILNDAMGIFQQYYPNTVRIDYDNSHTREIEQIDLSGISEQRSFEELVRDFYYQIYGCEISSEEMALMQKAAGEAGVIHETD